ncbi:unnamed protein product [Meloidogyne enterolobii]|uniref:Uncharacterized protein n=1 Tax=Meloidogyne enterolobii TaxID=390850 RepID=A0ACB1AF88_MELEN
MRGKAKVLLLPFNFVCLALILASFFDKNVAYNEDKLMATIQQNLIYSLFPGDKFPQTRYTFNADYGFEDWRFNQLVNIAEMDNTGMPRGSTQSNDVLMYDEWNYLQNTGNSGVFNGVFDIAVANLSHKVALFTSNNDNINSCDANDVENDLKEYDRIQNKTKKSLGDGREERKIILSRRKKWLSKICQCFDPSTSPHHTSHHEPSTSHHEISPPNTKNHCEALIQLIIRCKVFIRDLHSEGAEGSLIDIFSFMNNHEELGNLIQILNLSKIQSRALDKAINERIYQEHLKNKMRKGYKNAIVQGAGSVGLYAAYKLFIGGVNVTLVNDRSEEYIRNRVVFFDRKWMSQLRFFLGTEFDKLFIDKQNGEKSLGRILDGDIGFVSIKNMETALKERLKKLSEYIIKKEGKQGNLFLNLLYETAVLDINTQHGKSFAVLGTPAKQFNPSAQTFLQYVANENFNGDYQQAHDHIFQNYLEEIKQHFGHESPYFAYTRYKGDNAVEYINAETLAQLQVEGKAFGIRNLGEELREIGGIPIETSFGRNDVGIPFDLFFCAGGANDQIRNKFLEPAKQLTESKNYGVVIFNKEKPNIKVFEDSAAFYRDPMAGMRKHLVKQDFNGLIRQADFLSDRLKSKYKNLTKMILQDEQIVVRLFESNPTLHIASITPRALVEFIREFNRERGNRANELRDAENKLYSELTFMGNLEHWYKLTEVKDKHEEVLKHYDDFHDELQKKWARALFSYTFSTRHPERFEREEVVIEGEASTSTGITEEPNQILKFDPHSANTSTFWVAIYGIGNPVAKIDGSSAIIAAIGDANTSAHFMTASGISTGKFC